MSRAILDLYCGIGGAGMGYHRAGFQVVGVDINPQPNYGEMFGLRVIRHRHFEVHGFTVNQPEHKPHRGKVRTSHEPGYYFPVYGNGGEGHSCRVARGNGHRLEMSALGGGAGYSPGLHRIHWRPPDGPGKEGGLT